jgi:hypothetical protein
MSFCVKKKTQYLRLFLRLNWKYDYANFVTKSATRFE